MKETERQIEIALEIGHLSLKGFDEKPSCIEVHDLVWKAFNLGREYEKGESE